MSVQLISAEKDCFLLRGNGHPANKPDKIPIIAWRVIGQVVEIITIEGVYTEDDLQPEGADDWHHRHAILMPSGLVYACDDLSISEVRLDEWLTSMRVEHEQGVEDRVKAGEKEICTWR
jgi:hypothetical protein